MILKDLNAYGWINENYIENDKQREKIINYLYGFGSITSWEAYRDLGITQFAARVKELKEEGYQFTSKWENKKNC